MSRLVSFVVLVGIVVIFGILFVRVMARFLLPIFLALVLVVMFRPLHAWVIRKCRGRDRLAALLTTLAILLIVLVPMLWLLFRAASDGVQVASSLDRKELVQRFSAIRYQLYLSLPRKIIRDDFDELNRDVGVLRVSLWPEMKNDLSAILETPAAAPGDPITRPPSLPTNPDQAFTALEDVCARMDLHLGEQGIFDPSGAEPKESDTILIAQSHQLITEMGTRLDELKRLHNSWVTQNEQEPTEDDPGKPSLDTQLTQGIDQLTAETEQLRRIIFGEPWLYWLRVQANPESDETRVLALREGLQSWAGPFALSTTQKVGGFLGNFLLGIVITVVSLYYFLADGPSMASTIMRLSPLDERYERQILTEFDKVSRAVVVATLLSAAVQGILAGIGYFVAGIDAVFLLSFLTMLGAMIPFVGAATVWGSCALWLLVYARDPWAAGLLALYGGGVVSVADNVIKPIILHGQSNIHPLLALLSVLGGVTALGPIGIFFGPMAVAFLHALLYMLQAELSALSAPAQPTLNRSLD